MAPSASTAKIIVFFIFVLITFIKIRDKIRVFI